MLGRVVVPYSTGRKCHDVMMWLPWELGLIQSAPVVDPKREHTNQEARS